mmetsp:Transcript_14305/g.35604  ORF Transcript_14305/g.35604 Transcript_14305/m.35604 type:complete len:345 (-) Transcript_14305:913-1947(-)
MMSKRRRCLLRRGGGVVVQIPQRAVLGRHRHRRCVRWQPAENGRRRQRGGHPRQCSPRGGAGQLQAFLPSQGTPRRRSPAGRRVFRVGTTEFPASSTRRPTACRANRRRLRDLRPQPRSGNYLFHHLVTTAVELSHLNIVVREVRLTGRTAPQPLVDHVGDEVLLGRCLLVAPQLPRDAIEHRLVALQGQSLEPTRHTRPTGGDLILQHDAPSSSRMSEQLSSPSARMLLAAAVRVRRGGASCRCSLPHLLHLRRAGRLLLFAAATRRRGSGGVPSILRRRRTGRRRVFAIRAPLLRGRITGSRQHRMLLVGTSLQRKQKIESAAFTLVSRASSSQRTRPAFEE